MATRLSAEKVVNNWWLKTLEGKKDSSGTTHLSKQERFTLLLLAEMMNNVPRLCEFVNDFLSKENIGLSINHKFMKDLMEYVRNELSERYNKQRIGDLLGRVLPSLIFGEVIEVDEFVTKSVRLSLFTNLVGSNTSFIPETSMALLAHYTEGSTSGTAKAISDAMIAVTDVLSGDTAVETKGRLLEVEYKCVYVSV
jgi:hypothetical protein